MSQMNQQGKKRLWDIVIFKQINKKDKKPNIRIEFKVYSSYRDKYMDYPLTLEPPLIWAIFCYEPRATIFR